MPVLNEDLHGMVPDTATVALILIDVINDLEYPGGDKLEAQLEPFAENIVKLKTRFREAKLPVIYANDNFGKWQEDFKKTVRHCLEDNVRGKALVKKLLPDEEDYFVLKPKNSAFYATPLATLLEYLKVHTLVMVGLTGNSCVLFTAHDAFMRDYRLYIPQDCVISIEEKDNVTVFKHLVKVLEAEIKPASELDLEKITQNPN